MSFQQTECNDNEDHQETVHQSNSRFSKFISFLPNLFLLIDSFLLRFWCCSEPCLNGCVIGGLLMGIVFAVILTLYLLGRRKYLIIIHICVCFMENDIIKIYLLLL